ncbi:MAG: type I glyceraldehyde-3-phosphate dehydrogenase [Candidatus Woesearchaeota archaeon]|nr:type I glyceraldehyde-3-phosphate dehydrogenase [Candidatus Woesearchaeota archaeon]
MEKERQIVIGINGLGKLARQAVKESMKERQAGRIRIAAINDMASPKDIAYLLKYDSAHGPYPGTVEARDNSIILDDTEIPVFNQPLPSKIPWGECSVEIVMEATGLFRKFRSEKGGLSDHLKDSVKYVILTAPKESGDPDVKTIIMGVNDAAIGEAKRNYRAISNASCTSNALLPMLKVMNDEFGIQYGFFETVHAYTNDQDTIDSYHKKPRRGRTAGANIVPSDTGAESVISDVLSSLSGRLMAYARRVPVQVVSSIDVFLTLGKKTSVEEINSVMKRASGYFPRIIGYNPDEIVSGDLITDNHSVVFMPDQTAVSKTQKNVVTVSGFYNNERGYARRLTDLILTLDRAQ